MKKRQTAGELSVKASKDINKYDSLEVGHAVCDDMRSQLEECARIHDKIFDMDEYCIVMVIAGDPLLKNVRRRKFYAFPFLPSPRPGQAVFLYNKKIGKVIKRLWVLPDAITMETLYETPHVSKDFQTMKNWSKAFYDGCFWHYIRKEHGINMLSETEQLNADREKLIKSGLKELDPTLPQAFDFSKIKTNQVVDSNQAISNQGIFNDLRQA